MAKEMPLVFEILTQANPYGEVDLYTERVLRMILPESESKLFEHLLRKETLLSSDFCQNSLSRYFPSVLLPTDALTEHFHLMADVGNLRQMNLPNGWKNIFPLNSSKINASIYGSDLKTKQFIRQQCSDSVDFLYSNCFCQITFISFPKLPSCFSAICDVL